MYAWVPMSQPSRSPRCAFNLFPWLHVHIGVSVGFFLGLAQQFQGLSGSIGSNPERRFLQETYRLESQDVLTGAASKWEAHGIPTPHRWPHKEWNLTAKELETQDCFQFANHFSNPSNQAGRLLPDKFTRFFTNRAWGSTLFKLHFTGQLKQLWHSDLNTEVLPFLRCHHFSSSGNQGLVGVASNWAMEMHR